MDEKDYFAMPVVDLDVTRIYREFTDCSITNGNLKDYIISIMVEKIKLKIDEVGAKVEF
jgi:hypothetical protein